MTITDKRCKLLQKIGTATIIIEKLNSCIWILDASRISRAVATGFPHHVTQRGNYQQRVFEDNNGLSIYHAYCIVW